MNGLYLDNVRFNQSLDAYWKCPICNRTFLKKINIVTKRNCYCPICSRKKQGENRNVKIKCIETGIIYNSIKEAGIKISGKYYSRINKCLKNRKLTALGYHWEKIN